ncbi:glycosyltransferase family 4 protein [Desulfogranum marinum]|uniref:glycosyltransferase family 4 protein n=1 Tax=Desulfogranum marinum TaxID=453220 RepID=UPI001E5609E1|nr:glycosyltransferase family 1 protein [Desulfogranum marinum]
MKICIATDAWHPQINGVVTTLSKTIQTLKNWGHEVVTITPAQFTTIPCPTYPEIRLSLVTKKKVRKILKTEHPDAVHIATEGSIGWATRRACKEAGLEFTTSYHTRFPEYIKMRLPVPLATSYWVVKRFHGAAKRTMVAPTLIDELQLRSFENLAPWSRGVDTTLFKPRPKDILQSKRPIFVYVGRVAVEKNLPAFLDLDLPGSKYVIGDGPALQEYKKKYKEVVFTGTKKGEDLASHVAAADVFVFPSLTDTFGVVLLEAIACGVPVAAFPVTGPKFIVKNGTSGFVSNDLHYAAMEALKVAPDSCRQAAEAYAWEACTKQFVNNLAIN